ncbi:MAG: carbohydrate ABC transporter permease [Phycisphaerae bacterium]|nr:carbohydrate ABC transporter permease [Phycisphaerae bacterium]
MPLERPLPVRLSLHGLLLAGALIFSLPFLWMVGTSLMADKELFSEGFHMMPRRPIPRVVSPYVDDRQYEEIDRPDFVSGKDWTEWKPEIRRTVRASALRYILPEGAAASQPATSTRPPTTTAAAGDAEEYVTWPVGVDVADLEPEMIQGLWNKLRTQISTDAWKSRRIETILDEIRAKTRPQDVRDAIQGCYRRFSLGNVQVRTETFRQFKLDPLDPNLAPWQGWHVVRGDAKLLPTGGPDDRHDVIEYDLSEQPSLELEGTFRLPEGTAWNQVQSVRLSRCDDETYHQIRIFVEVGGTLYETRDRLYIQGYQWAETQLRPFDPTFDDSFRIRMWEYLYPAAQGKQYDHGNGVIRVRVLVEKSNDFEAWYAKARANYVYALRYLPFWRYAATSAAVVILSILLNTFSCSLVAFAFARLRWPGRDLCFIILLATLMIPAEVTMIPGFVIIKSLGWYNTLTPMWIGAVFGNAFFIFLLRQFMKGVPQDLEDAARIDGCGVLRIYWHVMLPLVKPTLAAIAIFTFMGVWNNFMTPLIYVNDQRLYPLALGLFAFQTVSGGNHAAMMAASLIMTTPVIVIFFFAQKYFIQGVMLTGMKG